MAIVWVLRYDKCQIFSTLAWLSLMGGGHGPLPDTCEMKKGRFSEAQIVAILQQQQSGQTVAQIVREHGLSEATFYAWKSKYAGASVAELTRLKHLEEENRRLKQMFADLSLENQAIKEILRKK
jgi:putative transposase